MFKGNGQENILNVHLNPTPIFEVAYSKKVKKGEPIATMEHITYIKETEYNFCPLPWLAIILNTFFMFTLHTRFGT